MSGKEKIYSLDEAAVLLKVKKNSLKRRLRRLNLPGTYKDERGWWVFTDEGIRNYNQVRTDGNKKKGQNAKGRSAKNAALEFDHLLGTMSDGEIAKMFDVKRHMVSYRRQKILKIPAWEGNPTAIDWSLWDDYILAHPEMSRVELAAKIGCGPNTVSRRRQDLLNPSREKTKKVVNFFKKSRRPEGSYTIPELAREMGVSCKSIYSRLKKGYFPGAVMIDRVWCLPAQDVERFKKSNDIIKSFHNAKIPHGFLSTAEVANILDITIGVVAVYCKEGLLKGAEQTSSRWLIPHSGLSEYLDSLDPGETYTAKQATALWNLKDHEFRAAIDSGFFTRAKKIKGTWHIPKKDIKMYIYTVLKEKYEGYTHLLGTIPDMVLAEQVGVSHTWIRKQRLTLSIPACCTRRKRIDWSKWDAKLLEEPLVPASTLAKRIGCDGSTVRERRRYLQSGVGKYAKSN